MTPFSSPRRYTVPVHRCIGIVFAVVSFLAFSLQARASYPDSYTKKINAKLAILYSPTVTTLTSSTTELQTATQVLILTDSNSAANYVYAALYQRPSRDAESPGFVDFLAGSQTIALKTLIGQGAIQATPDVSGSITSVLLSGTTGGIITDTVALGTSLEQPVARDGDACGQIAFVIASSTINYPIILDPTQYANDKRIPLAVSMMKAAPAAVSGIAEAIGQTMGIAYTTGTGLPPYADRERLAQFTLYLVQLLPANLATGAAIGFVSNNDETAPRIVHAMLKGNPKIRADKFIQGVAHVVSPGECLEIAAALAFGPGIVSASPLLSDTTGSAYPFTQPTVWLTGSNAKDATKIAGVLSSELAMKNGGSALIPAMAGIFANKLASFIPPPLPVTQSTYTKIILDVADISAKNNARIFPTSTLAVTTNITSVVTSAVSTAYGTNITSDIYLSLITNMTKVAGPSYIGVISAAVTTGAATSFSWTTLITDEVPVTNL